MSDLKIFHISKLIDAESNLDELKDAEEHIVQQERSTRDIQAELKQAKREIEKLRSKVEAKEGEIEKLKSSHKSTLESLEEANREKAALAVKIERLWFEVDANYEQRKAISKARDGAIDKLSQAVAKVHARAMKGKRSIPI